MSNGLVAVDRPFHVTSQFPVFGGVNVRVLPPSCRLNPIEYPGGGSKFGQ